MPSLVVDQLTLERSGRVIHSSLSFSIGAGEAMQVIGPNGVGKSTLLRAIAGLLAPARGAIRLEGITDADTSVAEQCHFVGHLNGIKAALTVTENCRFWHAYLQAPADPIEPQLNLAVERVGLGDLADVQAGYLSAGQKRRLALTRLILAPRLLWLLDEPTTSLDQAGQRLLADMAQAHLASGGLIVAATHLPLGFAVSRTLDLGRSVAAPAPSGASMS